ncbi:hypothetical protein ACQP00_20165 [Dactylosporangium sp. CS-047395]|uniref:hypothetical protein n=1 Tax=Dactylosporangium sp. CS-047395 TaxID=3239936 RepID=UPI003D8C9BE7
MWKRHARCDTPAAGGADREARPAFGTPALPTYPGHGRRWLLAASRRNSNQLGGIVEDLLGLANFDTVRLLRSLSRSTQVPQCTTAIAVAPVALLHHADLHLSVPPTVSPNGCGNSSRNNFTNTVKYRPHGGDVILTPPPACSNGRTSSVTSFGPAAPASTPSAAPRRVRWAARQGIRSRRLEDRRTVAMHPHPGETANSGWSAMTVSDAVHRLFDAAPSTSCSRCIEETPRLPPRPMAGP